MSRKIEGQNRTKKLKNRKTFFSFSVFKFFNQSKSEGFTLIELLLVIAILTVLFSLVIIAVNPVRQFALADNIQRRSNINAILNAVYQYAADNRGTLPSGIIADSNLMLGSGSGCADTSCGSTSTPATCLDLSNDLTNTYITDIPYDPDKSASTTSGYSIYKSSSNSRITVVACDAELGATISITR